MTKKTTNRQTEKAMYMSIISTALCVVMLIGMTFAWFTSTVESSQNVITTASFDAKVFWSEGFTAPDTSAEAAASADWTNLDGTTPYYDTAFMPGSEIVRYFVFYNNSSFSVRFDLSLKAIGLDDAADLKNSLKIYETLSVADMALTYNDMTELGTIAALEAGKDTNGYSGVLSTAVSANSHKVVAVSVMLPESYSVATSQTATFNVIVIASQNGVQQHDSAAYDPTQETTLSTPIATVTVPIGATAGDTVLTDADTLKLTVDPGEADPKLTISTTSETTTYEVNLTNQNGVKVTSASGIKVELDIGVVDLQAFYHNTKGLTKVNSLNDVDAIDEYYYDISTGKLTFITDSFSPFTSAYKFAGGIGTEEYPYLIKDYNQLVNIDVDIDARYPSTGTAKVYYKLIDDIDVAAEDGSNWCHSYLYGDPRTFVIDMNEKTISLGSKYLYGYARNLEMYNGTFAYSGVGTSVVDYACYQEVETYNMNFHDLTLTGSITGNGASHFGPLVSYAFGINSGSAIYTADKIINNLTITSSNSKGYVGGLFGYVQGPNASAVVTNCTFNGSISAPYAGGFLNPCSYPNAAAVTSTGNVVNGSLYGSEGAVAFGCNTNLTGGASAHNALNNSVTLGDNAAITIIAASTNLFTLDDDQIIVNKVDGAVSYRAAIVFSVGQGFPRYITKDITATDADTYATGLYKLNVVNEDSDTSAQGTLISSNNGSVIWSANGTYHFYSEDYNITSKNATICVYAFNADGSILTYQTQAYPLS